MDRVDSHTGLTVLGRPVCLSQGQRPEGADTGGIRGVGDPATEPLMSVVIVALLLVAGAAIGLAMGALGFLLTRSGGWTVLILGFACLVAALVLSAIEKL